MSAVTVEVFWSNLVMSRRFATGNPEWTVAGDLPVVLTVELDGRIEFRLFNNNVGQAASLVCRPI